MDVMRVFRRVLIYEGKMFCSMTCLYLFYGPRGNSEGVKTIKVRDVDLHVDLLKNVRCPNCGDALVTEGVSL
jgi:hypothetical protein